ncbi:MAG: type I restriction endonuclease [Candidatus Scalindua sp.]|nr:type I restriction endonuclease [Candidatus Scalindua sp.]
MRDQTKEKAFESYLEETLINRSGWTKGSNRDWDKRLALFPSEIIAFIRETQPALWQEMEKLHNAGADGHSPLPEKLIATLCKELDSKGTLHVLRYGFKFFGKTFLIACFKPSHGLNQEIIELYNKNRLRVTRQVPCHPETNETIDLVFSINGLPVATCELKNPGTGQAWHDAVRQYRSTRSPNAPLFSFKRRALVHFAADVNEVYMTTQLKGEKTFFLPFNRGSSPGEIKCGAGNPSHLSGYRTGYFWEEVLQKDSLLEIISSFMFLEHKEEKRYDAQGRPHIVKRETLIFPRYHQLIAVRNLIESTRADGAGHNYLIQHSAGSGKTNSISWLGHRLASLHNNKDVKIFDCVVVITDRRVLDRQLQDAIYQIEHAQGVLQAIDENSKQLAESLVDGTKIVITTLQKFPFVLKRLMEIAGFSEEIQQSEREIQQIREKVAEWKTRISERKYAVIVDEAHSSQTGETSRELKAILGAGASMDSEEEADFEDRLNEVMQSRGRQPNLSFFAFTATPKGKTIELFGRKGIDGKPEPFHVYSMRQAIEEEFILDVLKNYTTYKTYYKLIKKVEDDPRYPRKKASKKLSKFLHIHPVNVQQKTEVIVEHFRRRIVHLIGRQAKAMVVAGSRLQAAKYMQAFQKYIKEHGYDDIRPLVAFSGTVKDPETKEEFTEPGMNIDIVTGTSINEAQLADRFDTMDYQILLVANKYQTGYDQPKLCAMYVDKKLSGVQAVQTLSRLNRMFPGKREPFILDFVNDPAIIYQSFKPYYDTTELFGETDPQSMENLKHDLDQFQVYHWEEVEAFATIFYKPIEKQTFSDHARMEKHTQPAVDRFKAIEEKEQREQFRDKLSAYVRLYAFMSQIIPYADRDLEILYSFGRFLLPHLPSDKSTTVVKPEDDVALSYYRLERCFSGIIDLDSGEKIEVKSPADIGTRKAKDREVPLSNIIEVLNQRFHTEFKEEDRLFFEQIKEKACDDDRVIETAKANPLDKFELGIKKMIEDFMIQRMADNDKIVTRYMDDKDFQSVVFPLLAKEIFLKLNRKEKE